MKNKLDILLAAYDQANNVNNQFSSARMELFTLLVSNGAILYFIVNKDVHIKQDIFFLFLCLFAMLINFLILLFDYRNKQFIYKSNEIAANIEEELIKLYNEDNNVDIAKDKYKFFINIATRDEELSVSNEKVAKKKAKKVYITHSRIIKFTCMFLILLWFVFIFVADKLLLITNS